jgi:endoglucanase
MPSRLRLCLATIVAFVSLTLLAAAPALAGSANGGIPGAPASDPLAGMPWGHYTGMYNGVWSSYVAAGGGTRKLLGDIALRPTAQWFGAWVAGADAEGAAQRDIAETTNGNPDALTQIALFRLDPWEQAACSSRPDAANVASYEGWINAFAQGIGSARTAIVLQPDLAFVDCSPGASTYEREVAYAARRLSGLPHTTVYLDAGARYFPMRPAEAVAMLEASGVRYTRGIALNNTEYDSTGAELEYGAKLVGMLSADRIRHKHMVINTAENGAPWLNGQYPGNPENPRVCTSRHDRLCVTLGIPPTTDVANPQWGLSAQDRSLAKRFADAYLWVGRPWLYEGAGNFELGTALGLVTSSPF